MCIRDSNRGWGQVSNETQLVEFVQDHKLSTPIFNNYDIGSYLIYKFYPDLPVFVDNRPEAYSKDFLQNTYIAAQQDPEIWHSLVEEHQIQSVIYGIQDITPWARTFVSFIENSDNWERVYLDQAVAVWVVKDQSTYW